MTWRIRDDGYTLLEVLMTMAIIVIVFSIAVPNFFLTQDAGYKVATQSDARNTGLDVYYATMGYLTFGDTAGTIDVSDTGYVRFSPMTNAHPEPLGPMTTNIAPTLSDGSTLSGTYAAGGGAHWCIVVSNRGEQTVVSDAGLELESTGCNADGTPQ